MNENTATTGDEKEAKLVRRLGDEYQQSKAAEAPNRRLAQVIRQFYDGEQWPQEVKQEREDYGQPCIVINKMAKVRNNLIGRQRDSRLSWKAYPIGNSDVQQADIFTRVLKHIEDQTRYQFVESEACYQQITGPMGWIETRYDDSNPMTDGIGCSSVHPDEMYRDPFSVRPDLSDARYLIRARWVDLDQAIAAYYDKADALKGAVERQKEDDQTTAYSDKDDYGNGSSSIDPLNWTGIGEPDWCDSERQRVKLREHWWWENVSAQYIKLPDGRIYWMDEVDSSILAQALTNGIKPRIGNKRQFSYAIIAGETLLHTDKSPYRHEHGWPYVPVWCYRDRYGRPHGIGKFQLDPQRELNVNNSRGIESIRSRSLIYRNGALGNLTEDDVAGRLSAANFVLGVDNPNDFILGSDAGLTSTWLEMADKMEREIDDVAGSNEAAYGDKSNEKSGKAIQARVAQQGLNYGEIFDNIRFARRIIGSIFLSMVQQFWDADRIRRICEIQAAQDGDKDLAWMDEAFASFDVQSRYDVRIDDQAETTTERQATMQQAIDLIGMMPDQLKAAIVPDVIRMSDFKDKEEMAGKMEQAMQPPPMPPQGMPPQQGVVQ